MSISIHNGDITKLEVDAIVNAANDRLAPGGGVCGAIHRAAGPGLAEECAKIGGCPTGEARITGGHDLPARAVIHTVGPVWHGGGEGEPELLASCYRESLKQARKAGCHSVAFPSISAGVFGYPLDKAAAVAVETVRQDLEANGDDLEVIFCVFGEKAEAAYKEALSR